MQDITDPIEGVPRASFIINTPRRHAARIREYLRSQRVPTEILRSPRRRQRIRVNIKSLGGEPLTEIRDRLLDRARILMGPRSAHHLRVEDPRDHVLVSVGLNIRAYHLTRDEQEDTDDSALDRILAVARITWGRQVEGPPRPRRGVWRSRVYNFEIEEQHLERRIRYLMEQTELLPYILEAHLLDRVIINRAPETPLRPEQMRLRSIEAARRPDVKDAGQGAGRCVLDTLTLLFEGCTYGRGRGTKPITRQTVEDFFTKIGGLDQGFTAENMRDFCVEYNAGVFIALDAYGEHMECCYTNPDRAHNHRRPSIVVQCFDGHCYYLPKELHARYVNTTTIYKEPDYNKYNYVGWFGDTPPSREFMKGVAEISCALPVFIKGADKVHCSYMHEISEGYIPRVLSVDLSAGLVTGYVQESGVVIRAVDDIATCERLQAILDPKKQWGGTGVMSLSLELFEKSGLAPSLLAPDVMDIMGGISHYMHQYWFCERDKIRPSRTIDISGAFTYAAMGGLPRFTIHDAVKQYEGGEINRFGFYFVTGCEALYPLFGPNRWYAGGLVAALVEDHELSAANISHELVPSKVIPGKVVTDWTNKLREAFKNEPAGVVYQEVKKLSVGGIGLMKRAAFSQRFGKTQVFHRFAEAKTYQDRAPSKMFHICTKERGAYTPIENVKISDLLVDMDKQPEDAIGEILYVVVRAGDEQLRAQSHLPAWHYIHDMCALATYKLARTLIKPANWRPYLQCVCVDAVDVIDEGLDVEAYEAIKKNAPEVSWERKPGDYRPERNPLIKPVFDAKKRHIKEPYTKPVRTPQYHSLDAEALFKLGRAAAALPGGYGKTYTATRIYKMVAEAGGRCLIVCPTGTAMDVILDEAPEINEEDVMTTHHLFGRDAANRCVGRQHWTASISCIIFDEVFFNKSFFFTDIYKAATRFPDCKVFMFGDHKQLDPVDGSGAVVPENDVVFEIVRGNYVKAVINFRLQSDDPEVRQLADIVENLRDGKLPDFSKLARPADPSDPASYGICIAPRRDMVAKINSIFARKFSEGKPKRYYGGAPWAVFVGLRLMAMNNQINYRNGQRYVVCLLKEASFIIIRGTGDRKKTLEITGDVLARDFSRAYAITGHKVQGSTLREKYTIFDVSSAIGLFGTCWAYVALSRSTKLSDIQIGLWEDILKMGGGGAVKESVVYLITGPEGRKYVGSTCDLKQRLKQHQTTTPGDGDTLHADIQKHGWQAFQVMTLATLTEATRGELFECEREYIYSLQTLRIHGGYNQLVPPQ